MNKDKFPFHLRKESHRKTGCATLGFPAKSWRSHSSLPRMTQKERKVVLFHTATFEKEDLLEQHNYI
jgi:hypothetical protein